ncbi:CLUMA_CG014711, isoform A [Clunio marinus]|uniref:CLUMA_CG014711, isoform A n=1 Tax=Clunio marinus TaxID=568069 RepID=A0A1J1IN19_9DIPT|nr:CLUMA_CG014711, isoform A [Clunio marinus]
MLISKVTELAKIYLLEKFLHLIMIRVNKAGNFNCLLEECKRIFKLNPFYCDITFNNFFKLNKDKVFKDITNFPFIHQTNIKRTETNCGRVGKLCGENPIKLLRETKGMKLKKSEDITTNLGTSTIETIQNTRSSLYHSKFLRFSLTLNIT